MLDDICQIQLIVESSHQYKPMRSHFQNFFSTDIGCPTPISDRVFISPCRQHSMGLSQLISQIHTNNSRIVPVPHCELLTILEKFVLRKLISPPKAVSIVIRAAPHRCAGMVVEDYHKTHISKGFYSNIKDFQRCLTNEFWIGFEVLGFYDLVVEIKLEGIAEADAVHFELVSDVHGDITHWPHLEPIHTLPTKMSSRPVTTSQLDSAASGIYNPHAVSRERKGDVFDIEECLALNELQCQLIMSTHKGLISSHVNVSHLLRSLLYVGICPKRNETCLDGMEGCGFLYFANHADCLYLCNGIIEIVRIEPYYNCQNNIMDDAQQALPHNLHPLQEKIAVDAGLGRECTDLLTISIQSHEDPSQIAHCHLTHYHSQQTLRNYFSEQCGKLGTLITNFDGMAYITSIATYIVRLFKRITKPIIDSLHSSSFFANYSTLLARMKRGWKKQGSADRSQLEVSNNSVQSNKSWCDSLKELVLVGYALYGRKDDRIKGKDDEWKVTGQSAHTFIIETSLDQPPPNHQVANKTAPTKRLYEQGAVSWGELITVKILSRLGISVNNSGCKYIYITEKDIQQYKQKNEPLPTEAEYKKMMENFQALSHQCCLLRGKCYLIMDIIDEYLLPDFQRFCEEIKLKWTHYIWNGDKYNDLLTFLKCLKDLSEEESTPRSQPKCVQPEEKYDAKKGPCSRFIQLLTKLLDDIISDATCITSKTILNVTSKGEECLNFTQTSLVKKEDTKQSLVGSSNKETPLEETERKIKDSQKRMEQYLCWKELMVECKFRCRLGYNCPCEYNERQLEIEEKYMNRLLSYRNLLLSPLPTISSLPPVPSLPSLPTPEPQHLALNAEAKIYCHRPTSTDKNITNQSPFHSHTNHKKMMIEVKDHKKKKIEYDCISRKTDKKDKKPQLRLRRGLQDYSQQELNLLNLLNHMELEDTYRAPCYVEEDRMANWKKMGEKYRKETIIKANLVSR